MKKIWLIVGIVLLCLSGCGKKEETKDTAQETLTDAVKFKNEYESLNGLTNSNDKEYRSVDIPKNNPFIYKSAEEIVKMMENEETFVVYFGFSTCPWCRSILPTLISVADDLDLKQIYYVDIFDIRDTLELDEKGKVITSKEGTEGYYALLDAFSDVLEDYTLTNAKGKTVKTKEKRIYAPNIVSVVSGEAQNLTTAISDDQTDAYMSLTDAMIKDTYDKIECTIKCVVDANSICQKGC